MNKNIKKIIFFTLLLVVTIGIVSAANNTDTTTEHKITKDVQNHNNTNTITNENKNIEKNNENHVKTSAKDHTVTVDTYKKLTKSIDEAKNTPYSTYTINLKKKSYNATNNIICHDSKTKTIIINGNGADLNGQHLYQFLKIESDTKFIIKNIILTNFYGQYGGAINSQYDLRIENTTFNENKAQYNGGAIEAQQKVTIINSYFNLNTAFSNGGAINTNKGTITIKNTIFNRNNAQYNGGAINCQNINIIKSTFSNNAAYTNGGAINTNKGTVTIDKTEFSANNAQYDGGGINSNDGQMTIKNTFFTQNNGYTNGGAINTNNMQIKLLNSNFDQNNGKNGGAISSNTGKLNIYNSEFTQNHGNNGTSIYLDNTSLLSNNNKYTDSLEKEICSYIGSVSIHNNTFYELIIPESSNSQPRIITNIPSETTINKAIIIKGCLKKIGKWKYEQNIIITINNERYNATTNKNGDFAIKYRTKKMGIKNIRINYTGTSYYLPDSISQNLTVKNPSNIIIYKIPVATKGKVSKISGKLLSNNKGIKGVNVFIDINGKKYTKKTYTSGYFTVNYLVPTFNKRTVTITYSGNSKYTSTKKTATFKVKQKTKINLLTKGTITPNKTIKISGKLRLTNNKGVKGQKVTIQIGSKKLEAKTYSSGYFTVNHRFNSGKTKIPIKFIFNGSTNYLPSNASTTLTVVKT